MSLPNIKFSCQNKNVQRISTLHTYHLKCIYATGWLSVWLGPYSFASLPFDNFAEILFNYFLH
jgi:hypothetical protein